MKNNLKKIVGLLMVISMLFACSVVAFAAVDADDIAPGSIIYGDLTAADKDDSYKLTIDSYSKVLITISTKLRPYTLTVCDEALKEVWSKTVKKGIFETVTDESAVYELALNEGTYFFNVIGESAGSYKFKINVTATEKPEAQDTDKNNSIAASKVIELGKENAGKILKDNEEDYYKFEIKNSGTVSFNILSKMKYYCAYLIGSDGTVLWSTEKNQWDSSAKQREDTHKLELSAGTYYLKINGSRSGIGYIQSKGDYSFKLTFNKATETATEPNGTLVEARAITTNKIIKGHLSLTDANDFYEVTVKAGELAIGFKSKMSSYSIAVYDIFGVSKWSSTGNILNSGSTVRNDMHTVKLDAGKYYIRVYGGTGAYNFEMQENVEIGTVKTIKFSRAVTSITLNWSKVKGAAGYAVYRFDTEKNEYVQVGLTTSRKLKVKNLRGATTYSFKIKAYKKINGSKLFGDFSAEKKYTTSPAKGKITKLTAGKKSVTIKWNTVHNADGYRILYATDKYFDIVKKATVKDGEATETVIKKLKTGKKYFFKVRAYKEVNGKKLYGALSATKSIKAK